MIPPVKRAVTFTWVSAISLMAHLPAFGVIGITRPDFEVIPRSPFGTSQLQFPSSNLTDPPVPFSISINYSGDAQFQQVFLDAAAIWESLIPYYANGKQGAAQFNGIVIGASVQSIDGPGGTLGQAGPLTGGIDDAGYILATTGTMTFDADDFSSPTETLQTVVLHEMAHVLGIGTLWEYNGLYDSSAPTVADLNNGQSVGQYTGAYGLQAWQMEFDPDALFVPVEKGGGAGTMNGHWNEGDGGGATGYVSSQTGLDLQYELMTGWLDEGSFISSVTAGSLQDLGYEVDFVPSAVPEPMVMLNALLSCSLLLRRRRRNPSF